MLSPDVTATVRLTPALQHLAGLPDRLRNLSTLMTESIAPAAIDMLRQHWDTKGKAFGHQWAEWAKSTLASRARKLGTFAKGILRDEDNLFLALFAAVASAKNLKPVAGGFRLSIGANSIEDPIQRAIATFHQRGTVRMPERQIVPRPLPRSFRDLVRSLTRDWVLTGRLRGSGGRFVSAGAG